MGSVGYGVMVWLSGTRQTAPSGSKSLHHARADKHTGTNHRPLPDSSRSHVLVRRTVLGAGVLLERLLTSQGLTISYLLYVPL